MLFNINWGLSSFWLPRAIIHTHFLLTSQNYSVRKEGNWELNTVTVITDLSIKSTSAMRHHKSPSPQMTPISILESLYCHWPTPFPFYLPLLCWCMWGPMAFLTQDPGNLLYISPDTLCEREKADSSFLPEALGARNIFSSSIQCRVQRHTLS